MPHVAVTGRCKNKSLPVGVLPQSLTSLCLTAFFDTRNGIGQGVLPASLQRLRVLEWTLPLSNIVLPVSLTELDMQNLADHPLCPLPPQLQVLCIGGLFSQPLTGVLPPTLRVLRFTGRFQQPLTADMFACSTRVCCSNWAWRAASQSSESQYRSEGAQRDI